MKRVADISALIAIFSIACLVFSGCGSVGSAYKLDSDKSIKSEWGMIIQYKVGSNWKEGTQRSDKYGVSASYDTTEKNGESVYMNFYNTEDALYSHLSYNTYSGWLNSEEEYYTKTTPEEMAKAANAAGKSATADDYPTYSNYKISEIGNQTIGGVEWRLYKQSFTRTYSDKVTKENKESNPSFKQVNDIDYFYAVVKDGTHDGVIRSTDKNLFDAFLDTLEIKW